MKKLLFVLLVMWVGGAAGLWYWNEGRPQRVAYRTVKVTRGDLLATINATGTLEPEEVVDVGTQIAGEIQSFGRDTKDESKPISYGSLVEQGTVLAQLDDKLYLARVNQAKANVAKAEADIEQARVKARQTQRELARTNKLAAQRQVSLQEIDQVTADADAAKAGLDVALSARALSQANLEEASVLLGYAKITSPVKGVIVDRRVNIGQTVVASLNAPSLFLIAKDLSRMQIWASVNETDVGQIHQGQKVGFTVAAFPGERFRGKVDKIRLNASMSQSVVTYTVVVDVDNGSGKLLPYLTARLRFEVEGRHDALLVPNAALRWMPTERQIAPAYRAEYAKAVALRGSDLGEKGKGKEESRTSSGSSSGSTKGTLWVKDEAFVKPTPVMAGLTDGLLSEVLGDDLKEGAEVVMGLALTEGGDSGSETGAGAAGTSPFLPQIKNAKAKK